MATERMYELAFQYKGTKLWQQLYEQSLCTSCTHVDDAEGMTAVIVEISPFQYIVNAQTVEKLSCGCTYGLLVVECRGECINGDIHDNQLLWP